MHPLIVIITVSVFIRWLWIRMKPRHKLPPKYPGGLPLLGNVLQLPSNPIDIWKWEKKVFDFAFKVDGVILVKFLAHHYYVITDPDDALLVANACLDKPYLYSFAAEMYNKGLVTTDVSSWKPHRKLLNPAFKQQVLNSFLDVFNDQARALVTELAAEVGKDVIDFEMHITNYVLKTTCQTTLGLNTDKDNSLLRNYVMATKHLFETYFHRFYKIMLHFQCIFNLSSLKKTHDRLVKTLKDISTEVIRRKLETKQIKNNGLDDAAVPDKFQSLLDQMLHLADTQGTLTVDEIQDHVNTTIAAASDTTARSFLFHLILIGSHKDVQSRIIQELNEVFEGEDRNVTKSDLQKLVYLEAVIKESLRLYPPAPRIARYIDSDVKLKNYVLPAGSSGVISIHGINRHPMWGADADQFRPERWLDPASLPDNPNAFASFSLGRRNCIGKTYAMMIGKTTLVHMLRNYHITSTTHDLQTQCDVLQAPVKGHKIKLLSRKQTN